MINCTDLSSWDVPSSKPKLLDGEPPWHGMNRADFIKA
jgi:hypothetical protein